MNVRQHIPSFVEGVVPAEAQVSTTTELLALEWVALWGGVGFHRFSIYGAHLMAEYDEGKRWYVVAYLAQPGLYELPEWRA